MGKVKQTRSLVLKKTPGWWIVLLVLLPFPFSTLWPGVPISADPPNADGSGINRSVMLASLVSWSFVPCNKSFLFKGLFWALSWQSNANLKLKTLSTRIFFYYPPVSAVSREVANLTKRKNPHTHIHGVNFFCIQH